MAWYSEVTRFRLGKPEPEIQPQYRTRELYDSLEGYKVVSIRSFLHLYYNSLPFIILPAKYILFCV